MNAADWILHQVSVAERIITLANTPGATYTRVDATHLTLVCEPDAVEPALTRLGRAVKFMRREHSWTREGQTFHITIH